MNRKQLRARKAYGRKHALEIAWQHASTCYDLDSNGNYVLIRDPIALQTLRKAFERHLRLKDDVTFMRLTEAQSEAFIAPGKLVSGTVSVIAITRDKQGDLAYAIERCSGGSWNESELLIAAKRAAKKKLGCA